MLTTIPPGISSKEWEAMCRKCGECCRGLNGTHCPHLADEGLCKVYDKRELIHYCMSVHKMHEMGKMPLKCGYKHYYKSIAKER